MNTGQTLPVQPIMQPEPMETPLGKMKADLRVWCNLSGAKPNAAAFLRLALFSPGFQFTLSLRTQEAVRGIPILGKVLRRVLWQWTTLLFGCEVGMGAKIGGGVYFPHPWGIVIGDGSVIGREVVIFQQVTLGRRNYRKSEYPTIRDGAILYAGAKVFGSITIGEKSIVGSNAVVSVDVPNGVAMVVPQAVLVERTRPAEQSE